MSDFHIWTTIPSTSRRLASLGFVFPSFIAVALKYAELHEVGLAQPGGERLSERNPGCCAAATAAAAEKG